MRTSLDPPIVLCRILAAIAALAAPTRAAAPVYLAGVHRADAPLVCGAIESSGSVISTGPEDSGIPAGALVIIQPHHDVSDSFARRIGEHVRLGGSLLYLVRKESSIAPARLAFMLPTTVFRAYQGRAIDGPIKGSEFDPELFGTGIGANPSLDFHVDIRPFHAVERGQARYERFARTVQDDAWIQQPQKPGDTFWTRPLINRDWRLRIRGDNQAADGLLVTGRYGAGRVAVFGSDLTQLESWMKGAPELVQKLIGWLAPSGTVAAESLPDLTVRREIDRGQRLLRVTVSNPTDAARRALVLARLLTWEGALIGDVSHTISLPAKGEAVADLALPATGNVQYQALDAIDRFDIRLGILTDDGAVLAHEERFPVDLRSDPVVSVLLDDLTTGKYPYAGPQPDTVPHFKARLGSGTQRYSYKPGEAVNVRLQIADGVRNIAPTASVRDLTQPGNASVWALTDGNTKADLSPTQTIEAYGIWSGIEKRENVLEFTWPRARRISAVTLVGSPDNYRQYGRRNPGAAIVEVDGREVARDESLDGGFASEGGRVRLAFAPLTAARLSLRLPWVGACQWGKSREAPALAEVEIEGADESLPAPPPAQGSATLNLIDAETNTVVPVGSVRLTVNSGETEIAKISFPAPSLTSAGPHAFRLEASFAGQSGRTLLLVADPPRPLVDLETLKPPDAMSYGFIVTRGFRHFFDVGTGNQDAQNSWETPDDLVWCYEHLMKQEGERSHTLAGRLYVTSNDFRHYASPWRDFPNGQSVMELGGANLYAEASKRRDWPATKVFRYDFSDRWDTGPTVSALSSWQDYTEFDYYLRRTTGKGLSGRTRQELAREVREQRLPEWMAYQKAAYLKALHDLADRFEAAGRTVYISAQGVPLVSGPDASIVYRIVCGMSDDSTWGMEFENLPYTTGRQMGMLAFNPMIEMSTLFMWGWDSGILDNPFWRVPVGTTETSRRHQYDRAWRGAIDWDGSYKSIHAYGYNANGGTSYQMCANDWQEMWRAQERLSLIRPEAPIGIGAVISTAKLDEPQTLSFSGAGGTDRDSAAGEIAARVPFAVRRLQEAGVSVPFSANASALKNWTGKSPLILLNLHEFSDEEVAIVRGLAGRGIDLAVLLAPDEEAKLSPAARQFLEAPHDPGRIVKFPAGAFDLTTAQALSLKTQLASWLTIGFPPGVGGYGFTSGATQFIVMEDWREEGRAVELRLRASNGVTHATAVALNDHQRLALRRDGADWLIEAPTRPGDGNLIAVREESK